LLFLAILLEKVHLQEIIALEIIDFEVDSLPLDVRFWVQHWFLMGTF
jgi:hypothetical protein